MNSDEVVVARRRALLAWYDAFGRDLPWRRVRSLYGTWISEIMLQQTTVQAVIPRWTEFLERFPDVGALAAADEPDVLAAWSGLGYYRRARLLHQAARRVVDDLAGECPHSPAGWRDLPGVGEYAAGAIASIGLGVAVPAIDANVRRVLTRWACGTTDAARRFGAAALRDLATRHVTVDRPGDWNQALMDLGAGPCRAGQADCSACPLKTWCACGLADASAVVPAPKARPRVIPVLLSSLVLHRAGRVLLLPSEAAVVVPVRGFGVPVRRGLDGLFSGMVNVPSTPWYGDPGDSAEDPFPAVWRRWLRQIGWRRPTVRALGSYRHAITVHRLRVAVFMAEWPAGSEPETGLNAVWMRPDGRAAASTMAKRCLDLAIANGL